MSDATICGLCGLPLPDPSTLGVYKLYVYSCTECLRYAPRGHCDGDWFSWLERVIDRRIQKALAGRELP